MNKANEAELKQVKAVLVNDNSRGDNDQYWTFAHTDSNDDWYDNESEQKILEYEGDKILKVVELNTRPEPTLKSSDGLVCKIDNMELYILNIPMSDAYKNNVVGYFNELRKLTITPTTETASEVDYE